MNEEKLGKALQFLRKYFKNDKGPLELIDRLENCCPKKVEVKNNRDHSEFPLPCEVRELQDSIALFSDGACRGNPGPGAWAVFAQGQFGDIIFESAGVDTLTTNNKMELQAVISGLVELSNHEEGGLLRPVFIYSDSKYVVDGISQWVAGWKRRGWKKADKKTPENVELWKELDDLVQKFAKIKFFWVKGHNGHPQNERCDKLANLALDDAGF